MPWVDRDAYENLRADQEKLTALEGQYAIVLGELAVCQRAGQIVEQVRRDLAGPDEMALLDEAAERRAEASFRRRETERVTAKRTGEILVAKEAEWAADFEAGQAPAIRTAAAARLEADGTLTEHRQRLLARLERSVAADAEATAKAAIEVEVEAGRQEALVAAAGQYVASRDGQRYRERVAARLQKEVAEMTPDAVREKVEDEELDRLLRERAELLKAELAAKTRSEQLTEAFEAAGVDMDKVAEGSIVIISLGALDTIREKKRVKVGESSYGEPRYDTREVERQVCRLQRELKLCAVGDGHFVVNYDSLSASNSPYENDAAITIGTVITVGRRIVNAGEVRLDKRVTAGVELHYDPDVSTPHEFIDTRGQVANIEIDGVKARDIENVTS